MESQYLLELSEFIWGCGNGFRCPDAMKRAEEAARRLQKKCREQRPLVSITILNPRCSLNKKAEDIPATIQITDLGDQIQLPVEAV
jgi:hypothetical protein